MDRADEGTFDCGVCGQGQLVRTHPSDLGCRVYEPGQRGQGGPIRGKFPSHEPFTVVFTFPLGSSIVSRIIYHV